ncbi:MAG: argininosuccinate lyase, partial [Alphaproteobacteria bacterium]|nr:argininosuccinate lyase [Alphaproteobacteria bacterium]
MTELSDGLVRLEGIDFRTAYEIGSALARGLVARGAGMSALPGAEIAAAFLAAVGRPPALDLLELERLASVENFIAVRNRIGGPRKV